MARFMNPIGDTQLDPNTSLEARPLKTRRQAAETARALHTLPIWTEALERPEKTEPIA